MSTRTERAMALLESLNPIVYSFVQVGSPCGDPMGFEHAAVNHRLSDVLAKGGWGEARKDREVSRLLGALIDSRADLGGVA